LADVVVYHVNVQCSLTHIQHMCTVFRALTI